MRKMNSIESLRHILKYVKKYHPEVYKIGYTGTPKIHGTNAAIGYSNGDVWFQSKNNVITPEADNYGFATKFTEQKEHLLKSFKSFSDLLNLTSNDDIIIYGEWAGPGIQSKVAVSQLDEKLFFPFRVDINGVPSQLSTLLMVNACFYDLKFFTIHNILMYQFDLDVYNPDLGFIQRLVDSVEHRCPVGQFFGVHGVGEGVVFTPYTVHTKEHPEGESVWLSEYSFNKLTFKEKGAKHSDNKKKRGDLPEEVVKMISEVQEFTELVLTEHRMEKGLDYLRENQLEIEMENFGEFIKWLNQDIIKEESDRLPENFNTKRLNKSVAPIAKEFFMKAVYADVV